MNSGRYCLVRVGVGPVKGTEVAVVGQPVDPERRLPGTQESGQFGPMPLEGGPLEPDHPALDVALDTGQAPANGL